MRTTSAFVKMATMALIAALAACGGDGAAPPADLTQRAYVVSRDSDELTVVDLGSLEVVGRVATGARSAHMAELSADFGKIYVSSPDTNEVVVVDARRLEVIRRIPVGEHPTHLSRSRDGALVAVMLEWEGAVSFIDTAGDVERARLGGFVTPHFMRFAPDGRHGYVADAGASRVTRVDLATFTVDGVLTLDGVDADAPVADEGGFHDAQIDADGVLWAAHAASGRVLVYDTVTHTTLAELAVGARPWMVYAEHPFAELPRRYLVPNLGDETLSRIDGAGLAVAAEALPGDAESFGVNYSALVPDRAFVLHGRRQDVAVVDTATGAVLARIPVGGRSETASTTADGRHVIAAVSGADEIVVIDVLANRVVKRLPAGATPWSVTIPLGQNYCH
jgi:YVTN family beta-propeller protein